MNLEELKEVQLAPEEIAELNGPYTNKHAMEAVRQGMAQAISDAGLNPEDLENLLKHAATVDVGGDGLLDRYGSAAGMMIGAGALIGAGTGYLRHKINKSISGKDDPELIALRRKIKLYQIASQDVGANMRTV